MDLARSGRHQQALRRRRRPRTTCTSPRTAGEVHAILGENGAGKSTLHPDPERRPRRRRGRDHACAARPIGRATPGDARRAGIAPVFQELSLIPDLTVAENIWFGDEPLTPRGTISRRGIDARTRDAASQRSGCRRSPPDRPVRIAVDRRPAARRDRQGARARSRHPHPRRGHLGARAATTSTGCSSIARQRADAGQAGALHLAPHGRGPAGRRPRHGAAQRRDGGHRGDDRAGRPTTTSWR